MAPHIPIEELTPHAHGVSDPIVTQIAAEDLVKWYKKPNLRAMYRTFVSLPVVWAWT
jgi:hypothetical protein